MKKTKIFNKYRKFKDRCILKDIKVPNNFLI